MKKLCLLPKPKKLESKMYFKIFWLKFILRSQLFVMKKKEKLRAHGEKFGKNYDYKMGVGSTEISILSMTKK